MHKLTDDRARWGWCACLAGVMLFSINHQFAVAPRAKPHPVGTRAEAITVAEAMLHRRICATHCWSGPLAGMWFLPLWDGVGPRNCSEHRWAAVDAETGKAIPHIGICTYGMDDAPRVCKPAVVTGLQHTK
jgi:hypothetical protein